MLSKTINKQPNQIIIKYDFYQKKFRFECHDYRYSYFNFNHIAQMLDGRNFMEQDMMMDELLSALRFPYKIDSRVVTDQWLVTKYVFPNQEGYIVLHADKHQTKIRLNFTHITSDEGTIIEKKNCENTVIFYTGIVIKQRLEQLYEKLHNIKKEISDLEEYI